MALSTAATELVFITGTINAHEHRDVATMDLPGDFLHMLTDDKKMMIMYGEQCISMFKVDPKLYIV